MGIIGTVIAWMVLGYSFVAKDEQLKQRLYIISIAASNVELLEATKVKCRPYDFFCFGVKMLLSAYHFPRVLIFALCLEIGIEAANPVCTKTTTLTIAKSVSICPPLRVPTSN